MKTVNIDKIIQAILRKRGIVKKDSAAFLYPKHPDELLLSDIDLHKKDIQPILTRIKKAITKHESIVVYTDYDADGLTAGAIVWETIHHLGGSIMPYVPHRVDEGYGLTKLGIDAVYERYKPALLITVDHGITASKEVDYLKTKGMDVIVTDHHVKPEKLPACLILHTTKLSGAGVAYILATQLLLSFKEKKMNNRLMQLAAIGTVADMMPLLGPNRSIVKYGLEELNSSKREGIRALISQAGLEKNRLTAYDISHILAPRLNAVGRIEHAIDGLRLLCTNNPEKAKVLASKLGTTNRERQQLTIDTTLHAKDQVRKKHGKKIKEKVLFIAHESYNQGIIGLVAGKLVETYYVPAVVVSKGDLVSKASARSIKGFNIVEAIRSFSDLLIDVGGHPMAAGFTVDTKNLDVLERNLIRLAEKQITDQMLTRPVSIDYELPIESVSEKFFGKLQELQPFGFGNPEPVFLSRNVPVVDFRTIGAEGKHLKLQLLGSDASSIDAIAFNYGNEANQLKRNQLIDITYAIDMNQWNGKQTIQLKVKTLRISS